MVGGNPWDGDGALAETLERLLPGELLAGLSGECRAWGEEVARSLDALGFRAEVEPVALPRSWPVAPVPGAAGGLVAAAVRWGLVAIPSEERLGPWARIHQMALLMLAPPGSPRIAVSHTDAVARVLLAHDPVLAGSHVPRLISREPRDAWQGVLWLEDPSPAPEPGDTRTVARAASDGGFLLSGRRGNAPLHGRVALVLARPEGASPGIRGLSLFLVSPGDGLRVERVENRPGDAAWLAARVALENAAGDRVGDLGEGAEKLALGRRVAELHQTAWACGLAARLVATLRAATRGEGRTPSPLRRASLAGIQVEREAGLALAFECARLLGLQEAGEATQVERRLQSLLLPLARLLAVRQVSAIAAEVAEGLGSAGGLDETGLPRLLRDVRLLGAAAEPGDAVCLGFLHEARRDDRIEPVLEALRGRIHQLGQGPLADLAEPLARRLEGFAGGYRRTLAASGAVAEAAARGLAYGFAALAAAVPLAEQAAWSLATGRSGRSAAAVRRWIAARIPRLPDPAAADARLQADALLGGSLAERVSRLARSEASEGRGRSGEG
jgi:hypothetical protein